MRLQFSVLTQHHILEIIFWRDLSRNHNEDRSCLVKTSSNSSTSHLSILSGKKGFETVTIALSTSGKCSSSGQVEIRCKRLSGKQNTVERPGKQNLDNLLYNRQQTRHGEQRHSETDMPTSAQSGADFCRHETIM